MFACSYWFACLIFYRILPIHLFFVQKLATQQKFASDSLINDHDEKHVKARSKTTPGLTHKNLFWNFLFT